MSVELMGTPGVGQCTYLALLRMMTWWRQQNGNAHEVQKTENTTAGESGAYETVLTQQRLYLVIDWTSREDYTQRNANDVNYQPHYCVLFSINPETCKD